MSDSAHGYGVTPPILVANPTPKENEMNDGLIKELKLRNSFEAELATRKRVEVLTILQKLAEDFVYTVSKKKNMSEGMAKDAGGKIFTFGSYKLGVYGPGSDIDALLVVPKHISRSDFFDVMPQLLRQRPELEEMAPVPDAFVPIIKLEFGGISIDLLFARLDVSRVPLNLTLDDKNLLRNVDEKDLRALNGTRVTDEILRLVPKQTVFKHALRCIKMWAQQRAVYGNVFGFPGGVAWAMLVARICQLYPNAVGAVIVGRVFQLYYQWLWPQPVVLKKIEDGPLQVRVWNPTLYPGDRHHKMPVITPSYPLMCATHNINALTFKVIMAELKRGKEIMDDISAGKKTWGDLFQRHDFFFKYKFYLCIVALTHGAYDDHIKYSGMVESKVRLLVQRLETVEGVELAHPYVKPFDNKYFCASTEVANNIVATYGDVKGEKVAEGVPTERLQESDHEVHLTKFFIGLQVDINKCGDKKLDIQQPCADFISKCKAWADFDAAVHGINIRNVKVFDLPSDVYVAGVVRPQRISKRKRVVGKGEGSKRPKSVGTVVS